MGELPQCDARAPALALTDDASSCLLEPVGPSRPLREAGLLALGHAHVAACGRCAAADASFLDAREAWKETSSGALDGERERPPAPRLPPPPTSRSTTTPRSSWTPPGRAGRRLTSVTTTSPRARGREDFVEYVGRSGRFFPGDDGSRVLREVPARRSSRGGLDHTPQVRRIGLGYFAGRRRLHLLQGCRRRRRLARRRPQGHR